MKTWTVKVLGREILTVEFREEASIADVVRHMVAQRLGVDESEIEIEVGEPDYTDVAEGLIPCEYCGEMYDPEELEEDEAKEVNARFADMTEQLLFGQGGDGHLIWGPASDEETGDEV